MFLSAPDEENNEISVFTAEGLPGIVGWLEENAGEAAEVERTGRQAVSIEAEEKWPVDVKQLE